MSAVAKIARVGSAEKFSTPLLHRMYSN
jgi:hypothetical protein